MFQLALTSVTLVFSAYAIRREIRLTEHFETIRARSALWPVLLAAL